jgi:copper chaperone NosL
MKPVLPGLALLAVLFAAGCGDDDAADAPPPVALTQDAIGHFCGMSLVEHPGPKGQILLRGNDKPVWFSSARDAIAFTYLGEEAKAIRAIYVSDMGRAESWEVPGATNWVDARRAHFVLGSDRRGGMGTEEAVPFSDAAAAARFVAAHGGRVLAFAEVPRDWVLGDDGTPPVATKPSAAPLASPAASPQHAH